MIKILWKGLLFDGKRLYIHENNGGTCIKVQGEKSHYATSDTIANLKGYLSDETPAVNIGLIRCKDLAKRKQLLTEDVYLADITGYKYITVQSNGFNKIRATIYTEEEPIEPGETELHEYEATIILDDYDQTIIIQNNE